MSTVRETLEDIAVRVLGVRPEDLAGATLSDLGLTSVTAVVLVEEINAALGRDLPSSVAFEFGDLDALATHLERPAATPRMVSGAPSVPAADDDVAVVGLAARAAGAPDADALWELVRRGEDGTEDLTDGDALALFRTQFPEARTPRYGRVADADAFDAAFFRISPRQAEAMDAAQRVLLEECYHALEDAGVDPASLAGRSVATVVGSTGLPPQTDFSAHAMLGADASVMAARLAYHLDLAGPALAIDTACSSSLVALDTARRLLRSGEVDVALCAGVTLYTHPGVFTTMEGLGFLSPSRRCRPFDRDADGMLLGEGVGVLVLKRLSDARRDHDRVVAVLRGSGTNQDGRTSGITAPSGLAQTRLIQDVHRRSGVDVDEIGYVEAHGTGTVLGDPIEVAALTDALVAAGRRAAPCPVGSVKGVIGHTTAAAGVLGAVTALQAMSHGRTPPATGFRALNERIDLRAGALRVTTDGPWPATARGTRACAVSSFGYSGTNAHAVFEQVPDPRDARIVTLPATGGPHVVPLSAQRPDQLLRKARDLVAALDRAGSNGTAPPRLGDVAYTLATGREAMPERLAVVATTLEDLLHRLRGAIDRAAASGDPAAAPADGVHRGRVGRGAGGGQATNGTGTANGTGPVDAAGAAAAWCAGTPVDWARLHTGSDPRRIALPGHPFDRTRFAPRADPQPAGAPAPRAGAVPSLLPEVDRIAEDYLTHRPESVSADAARRSDEVSGELNDLCRSMMLEALSRAGGFATVGERRRADELADALGVVAEHRVLVAAVLEVLADHGLLAREADAYVATPTTIETRRRGDRDALQERTRELAGRYPDLAGFLRLLGECVDALPDILTGRRKAHEVLFPGGSFEALEDVYYSNEGTNALVAAMVSGYASSRLDADPAAALTVLEVGAGTGGTSRAVLPALDAVAARAGGRLRYLYTDVSRSFTRFGQNRFGADHPFAEFVPFDVERPPGDQDLPVGTADVVLASNVLHATRSMDRTLGHVAQVLRPGGLLVLMEATRVQEFFTLTFGLTPGWWNAEDERLPGSPLLSAGMWRRALERAGLGGVRVLSLLPFREDRAPEAVVVAERDDAAGSAPGAVPAAVPAVVADTVPAPVADAEPVPAAPAGEDRSGGGGGAVEALVVEAWKDVLGLPAVGRDADFADLGGDSILATQIISRLKSNFPFELELSALFEAATVAEMARLVEEELVERIDELPDDTVRALLV